MSAPKTTKINCIYCKACSLIPGDYKADYHIAPYALGERLLAGSPGLEHVLPKGIVCDKCNNYFGTNMEIAIIGHPFIEQHRAFLGLKGRGKTQPEYKDDNVKIQRSAEGRLEIEGDYENDANGNLFVPLPDPNKVDHLTVSRSIYKMAIEYLISIWIKIFSKTVAVNALDRSPLKSVVRYIRCPRNKTILPYGVSPTNNIVPEFTIEGKNISNDEIPKKQEESIIVIIGLVGARFTCAIPYNKENYLAFLRENDSGIMKAMYGSRHTFGM